MHRIVIVLMVLEVGRRGGPLASESQEMDRIVIIFMVWEVDRKGGRLVS